MATTDLNSPHVLTNSRLNESQLTGAIAKELFHNKDLISEGKYPDAAKSIAKVVNTLYGRIFIEVYYKGLKDGNDHSQAMEFSQMEKTIEEYEKENGPIDLEPIGNPVGES